MGRRTRVLPAVLAWTLVISIAPGSVAATATAAAAGAPTVTRVDSSVHVTPDSTGRVMIPYCPAADPCELASPPAGVVVTGRAPNGGEGIPANLVAYNPTTTGFTLRALDQNGVAITTAIDVFYHAATELTGDEELRTVTLTTDASMPAHTVRSCPPAWWRAA